MTNLPKNKYFGWLCDKVDSNGYKVVALAALYNEEFFSLVPNDENRGDDGLDLRKEYIRHSGHRVDGTCNALEMVIALARRMAYVVMEPHDSLEEISVDIFWELIANLGLGGSESRNQFLVSRFLNRRYQRNGKGGIFPLQYRTTTDQRDVELWYQMQAYIKQRIGE